MSCQPGLRVREGDNCEVNVVRIGSLSGVTGDIHKRQQDHNCKPLLNPQMRRVQLLQEGTPECSNYSCRLIPEKCRVHSQCPGARVCDIFGLFSGSL